MVALLFRHRLSTCLIFCEFFLLFQEQAQPLEQAPVQDHGLQWDAELEPEQEQEEPAQAQGQWEPMPDWPAYQLPVEDLRDGMPVIRDFMRNRLLSGEYRHWYDDLEVAVRDDAELQGQLRGYYVPFGLGLMDVGDSRDSVDSFLRMAGVDAYPRAYSRMVTRLLRHVWRYAQLQCMSLWRSMRDGYQRLDDDLGRQNIAFTRLQNRVHSLEYDYVNLQRERDDYWRERDLLRQQLHEAQERQVRVVLSVGSDAAVAAPGAEPSVGCKRHRSDADGDDGASGSGLPQS